MCGQTGKSARGSSTFRYQYYRCFFFSFADLVFSEISLKMKYCEILFDLENIFDILMRAAS